MEWQSGVNKVLSLRSPTCSAEKLCTVYMFLKFHFYPRVFFIFFSNFNFSIKKCGHMFDIVVSVVSVELRGKLIS